GELMTLGADEIKDRQYGWVLTRLHARYDKSTLSDDLVFREAQAIVGGRSGWDGQSEGNADAQPSSANNFQGRYIIHHYWEGKVACAHPIFDRWGGPPDGHETLMAAHGLASAARDKVDLKRVINSPVPRLGLSGHARPKREK